MKQFILFIIMCITTWQSSIMAQDDWESPDMVIDGVAYCLRVVIWDTGGPQRNALIKPLSNVTGEKYSGNVVIPESVEYDGEIFYVFEMADSCFVDCEELESVTFTTCVSISDYTFNNCPMLKRIEMGEIYPMFWTNIGVYGISNCPNLKELIISSDVTALKNNAIEASGLEELELPGRVGTIRDESLCLPSLKELTCRNVNPPRIVGDNPFGSGDKGINLRQCVLRVPAGSVEAYKAAAHWKEFGQILPIEDAGIVAPEVEAHDPRSYDLLGRQASGKGLRIVNGKKTLAR